jgi:hypothetical protein
MEQPSPRAGDDAIGPPTRFDSAIYAALFLIVAILLALLPSTLLSIEQSLFGRNRTLYIFPGSDVVSIEDIANRSASVDYYNVLFSDIKEEPHTISIAVSGERRCRNACTDGLELTLVSYDARSEILRGVAQSVTVPVPQAAGAFSLTEELPVVGWPGTYPFDTYHLRLGVSATQQVNGTRQPVPLDDLDNIMVSFQNGTYDMDLARPIRVPMEQLVNPADAFDPIGAVDLEFKRPFFLRLLSVSLFMMMAISMVLGLFSRSLPAVVFGNAGLLLGIYSIKSVLVPYSLTMVTAVDIAAQLLILFMLIGLIIRIAAIVRRRSGLSLIPGWRPRQR